MTSRILIVGLSLMLPSLCLAEPPADAKKAAIAYVRSLQNKDGGFRATAAPGPSTLSATSGAVRALKYLGAEVPDPEATRNFVAWCYEGKVSGFADTPRGEVSVRLTAIGLMAVVELKMPRETYESACIAYMSEKAKEYEEVRMAAAGLEAIGKTSPKAGDWIKQIEALGNAEGSFGKGEGAARDTGGSVALLLRLGAKLKNEPAVLKTLEAGLRSDGGYGKADAKGSDLETTYRVIRTYHMLGKQPGGAEKIRAFVAKCQNADGGYGVAPGQPSSVSATYFASIVTKWLDGK